MTIEVAPKTVPTPCGKKPPCAVRLLKSRLCCGQKPENEQRAERQERDDRGDFDSGEPEFELTEGGDGEQVGRRHRDHQDAATAATAAR